MARALPTCTLYARAFRTTCSGELQALGQTGAWSAGRQGNEGLRDCSRATWRAPACIHMRASPSWPALGGRSGPPVLSPFAFRTTSYSSRPSYSSRFPSLFFLNSALFWELQEWKKPKRTGFGFRIQLIGSGRHGTQRLTMNIPVGVLVLLVQVRSLHDIHYSLIGYLPRSGVWQQNRARLSATGPQIRADETHAKFVRWITSPCLCRARVRDSCHLKH